MGKNSKNAIQPEWHSGYVFYGHTYKPGYEDFLTTCTIYGYNQDEEKEILYDENDCSAGTCTHKVLKTGSKEKAKEYVNKQDVYVVLE